MHVYVSLWICVCAWRASSEAWRVWDLLEPEWLAVVTHTTWALVFPARAAKTIIFLAPKEYLKLFHCCAISSGLSVCHYFPVWNLIINHVPKASIQGLFYYCPLQIYEGLSWLFLVRLFSLLWSTVLGGILFASTVFQDRQKCDWILSLLDVWFGAKLFNFPELRYNNRIAPHPIRKSKKVAWTKYL